MYAKEDLDTWIAVLERISHEAYAEPELVQDGTAPPADPPDRRRAAGGPGPVGDDLASLSAQAPAQQQHESRPMTPTFDPGRPASAHARADLRCRDAAAPRAAGAAGRARGRADAGGDGRAASAGGRADLRPDRPAGASGSRARPSCGRSSMSRPTSCPTSTTSSASSAASTSSRRAAPSRQPWPRRRWAWRSISRAASRGRPRLPRRHASSTASRPTATVHVRRRPGRDHRLRRSRPRAAAAAGAVPQPGQGLRPVAVGPSAPAARLPRRPRWTRCWRRRTSCSSSPASPARTRAFSAAREFALMQPGTAFLLMSRAAVVDLPGWSARRPAAASRPRPTSSPRSRWPADDPVRGVEGMLLSAHRTGGMRTRCSRSAGRRWPTPS